MSPVSLPAGTDPEAIIARTLAYSRYAQRLANHTPAYLSDLKASLATPWTREAMQAQLDAAGIQDEESLKHALRLLRQQVVLRLMARDLGGLADLQEVMTTMTVLAEVAVNQAMQTLVTGFQAEFGVPIGDETGTGQQLLVVGMGKLGSGELNVSSDIDLIFAYAEEGSTNGERSLSNHEYFTRLGRKLNQVLSEATGDGFVFRVDMRLRPYGEAGTLVSSFAALEEYYLLQGREWERYAWIKGRVIHGEPAAELMQLMRPFVFRKYLDFGAFSSMRDLHGQIMQQVRRRDLKDNIKIGPGGIREIEFAAQVFQLIRGGRDPAFQIRPTVAVLDLVKSLGLMPAEEVNALQAAYVFLRNLEHRLQYLDDAQTHALPRDPADQQKLAEAMNFATYPALLDVLDQHRQRVSRQFHDLFAAPQANAEPELAAAWNAHAEPEPAMALLQARGFQSPQTVWARLQDFRNSSRYAHLPASSKDRLDTLIPLVIETASQQENPDDTLVRILNLVETISRRESYLAMLEQYPLVLARVADICSASPWAADYLARHPMVLDEVLTDHDLGQPPDWPALGASLDRQLQQVAGDTEQQMDRLRQFKNAQVFNFLTRDLAGLLPVETLGDDLSALADMILDRVLKLCWQSMRHRHREEYAFAIIAYGKLGGKELGYESDLDIIFLYEDTSPEAPEVYARLAQRVNTWLSSYTAAGILYETDLRLRPNGASGLLVSSVAAFTHYQEHEAWVWEHQALTRARFTAGDAAIGSRFEAIRNSVLRQPRDLAVLAGEITTMREKMLAGHPNPTDLFDIKHDRGGMVDVEFMVQYLVLGYSHTWPALTGNIGNLALLKVAAELGLVTTENAMAVRDAYRQYRRWQHALRLQGAQYARIDPARAQPHVAAVRQMWAHLFGRQQGTP